MKGNCFVYVSTHTGVNGAGVYRFRMDRENGGLTDFRKVASLERAGTMVRHPTGNFLYVVGIDGKAEDNRGCVDAYAINADTGALELLCRRLTGAGLPTFITISPDGRFLLQASFSAAVASVLKIEPDGSLTASGALHRFEGIGANPVRQTRAHPHCIIMHPVNPTVFVSDLGTDEITRFHLDRENGDMIRAGSPQVSIRPGAGPRIMRFSRDGRHVYIINELDNTISVYRYKGQDSPLEVLQVVSSLPDFTDGHFSRQMASEIRLHPGQQYLYVTNRSAGEGTADEIAVFRRDEASGMLQALQHCPTGIHPRHFNIDPSGKWLLVSARDSDQIHRFRIDPETGLLEEISSPAHFREPWDIQFYMD